MPIQEPQFGVLAEICNQIPFSLLTVAREEPAKVRAPKPAGQWRMEIFLRICDEVVAPVVSGPPERAFLVGRGPNKRHQKLENSAGPVRSVCEEAMKSGCNREHA